MTQFDKQKAHVEPTRDHGFPPTHWTLVSRARETESHIRIHALNTLLSAYRPVLLRYLVGVWHIKPEQAEDLLQDFIAERILEKQLLDKADHTRGRFRSFLLKCLTNHVKNSFRRDQAIKRGPRSAQIVNLDEYAEAISDESIAHQSFDHYWARQTLELAIERMNTDCNNKGRNDIWIMFKSRILDPIYSNTEPIPYESLIEQLKLKSPSQAMNLLTTAKRNFRNMLVETIRETVTNDVDINQEINALQLALK